PEDGAVDGCGTAKVPFAADERAGLKLLLSRTGVLRGVIECRGQLNIALILRQQRVALGMEVVCRPAIALDEEAREIDVAAEVAAFGRNAGADLRGGRAKTLTKDDVHDLLIGPIAIFQRDFLGQDLDA